MENQQASPYQRYIINLDGTITSKKTQKHIVQHDNNSGYPTVTLLVLDKPKTYKRLLVHRLVAETYLGLSKGYQVNHIDGNKQNNSVSNLEWVTRSQNMQHAIANGLMKIGEGHHNAKLTEIQVNQICQLLVNSDIEVKEIAKRFNVAYSTINNIVQKHRWVMVSDKHWLGKLQRLGISRKLQA